MKKVLILVINLFLSQLSFSQYPMYDRYVKYEINPDKNLFLSPDVSAFQKHHFQDINLYTGRVNVNIPFFEIETGDIKIPISLSYNSSGIKIDDIASSVGSGWNLNAGGSIYRNIKDIEDWEYQTDNFYEEDWDLGSVKYQYVSSKGFNRDLNEIENPLKPYAGALPSWYPYIAKLDASPDHFNATTPGLNTTFYVNKNSQLIFIDGNGAKANPANRNIININKFGFDNRFIKGIKYLHLETGDGSPIFIGKDVEIMDYDKFEILNLEGIKYTFETKDIIESIPGTLFPPGHPLSIPGFIQGLNYRYYTSRVSTWHVDKIEDTKKNIVNFVYEKYTKPSVDIKRNRIDDALRSHANPFQGSTLQKCIYGHMPNFHNYPNPDYRDDYERLYKVQEFQVKSPQVNRIIEINWDGGAIHFEYGLTRQDIPDSDKALTKIIIKDRTLNTIKSYELNYTYFISKENCSAWNCKRLKLDYIDVRGTNNSTERYYSFEYEYSNPLPKVYSLQQDFLGYYNNNGVEYINDEDIKSPILYYHKNQGKNSVLPFQLSSGFTTLIPGDFSLESNTYSLSGLLKKVTYPTGGYSEFEYENHKFIINNSEYTAGGARIKRQKLNDGNGNERILNYEYTENNKSSGYINNLPVYGYPFGYDYNKTSNNVSFAVFDKSKNTIELTDGAFVGYSRVVEREQGNGYKEYFYHSTKDHPNEPDTFTGANVAHPNANHCINFFVNNSNYPGLNYIDNDVKRAKLYLEKVYDQSNDLLIEKTFNYDHKIFNTMTWNYRTLIDSYVDNPHFTDPSGMNYFMEYSSKLRTERNVLSEVVTKEHLSSSVVETTETYVYDANLPLIKENTRMNSFNESLKVKNKYPHDLVGVEQSPYMQQLVNANRLSTPIKIETFNNNTKTSETHIKFGNGVNTGNILLPTEEYHKKGSEDINISSSVDRKIQYLKYNEVGNLELYNREDGTPVRIVWGYNINMNKGLHPIAKIVNPVQDNNDFENWIANAINLSNGDISNCFGADIFGACEESMMRGIFDKMRELYPNSLITSYTYDPLIGITSVTQPNGQIEYYRYDDFGRLKYIYDNQEKLVKEYNYHFKD